MILVEQTLVPDGNLPMAELRDHLHLGSGFAEDGLQDAVLLGELRAAIAAIEGRTGKALLSRDFLLVINAWRDVARQVLPVAPVSAVTSFTIQSLTGGSEVIDPSRFRLRFDTHAPEVLAVGYQLPVIPVGGSADMLITAGYGLWAEVPADLRQAVLLLAAHFYENRSASVPRATALPLGVAAICRKHTPVRLTGARRL